MLIDCSYFSKGARHILNCNMPSSSSMPNPNSEEVCSVVQSYIDENQEMYLRRVLGNMLGWRIHAYLVCLEEDETTKRNAKFDAVCDQLREPFADYVFYHILRDSNEQSTITGIVQLKGSNTYVAPIRRQVTAWNRMVMRHRSFAEWVKSPECMLDGISIHAEMLSKINTLNL